MDHKHNHGPIAGRRNQASVHEHHHQAASATSGHEGHSKHEGHSVEGFEKKFYISLLLTVPVLALSPMIHDLFGIELRFPGDTILLFIFSSLVFFYGGAPFLKGSLNELRQKLPGMMTLISLAIVVAYFYSSMVVFGFEGDIFFWELATLIDIMLLGHWLEMKSVMGASRALEKLSRLIPDKAHILRDGKSEDVEASALRQGDTMLIKPGEKIPADGTVLEGGSSVNESMLTGESVSVMKAAGSKLIGGSINEDGSLTARVEGVGEASYLSKVINLVRTAQASKSRSQVLADKAALWLTLIAVSVGALTFGVWVYISGDLAFAIERTATVLIIACPHALGLAVPLVVAISTALSAQNGLLIRNRTAFENSRKITTIVFDKTGTLTEGAFSLVGTRNFSQDLDENGFLRIAASLEMGSEHPIAKAILKEAQARNIIIPEPAGFKAFKGKGIEGMVDNRNYIMASPGLAEELGIAIPQEDKGIYGTIIYLIGKSDSKLLSAYTLSDKIRPESFEAVASLKKEGVKLWMLTGDNDNVARKVSEELKLDGYFAQVLPDQKQDKIRELQSKGENVAMVGDGINDAPALAQADVGIAIGSGTDIAAETADIVLVNSNPKDIASLILFGKATYRKMVQNLLWATGYNVVAIPLAAGVLYDSGILLSPALGAVFMSLSTIIVAVNANTLKVEK